MVELLSKKSQTREIAFTAQFENLARVRDFVARAGEESNLEAAGIYAVQLAVDEACSNIIEHAYGGECQQVIRCTCRVAKNELVIQLQDYGKPFNHLAVKKPDLNASLEERNGGGLGLHFMRALMDEVKFSFTPSAAGEDSYNLLTMVKRRKRAP